MNIPKGYKLVPVVPTDDMIESVEGDSYTFATGDEEWEGCVSEDMARDIYTRMLTAVPTPQRPIHSALNFVCTALPGPGNECAFVELENDAGESLGHGEWRQRDDGLVELHIAAPQPIYDEAKERDLFESFAVNRRGGYGNLPFFVFARKDNGQYNDGTAELAWEGWKACAQSRAKGGVDAS